LKLALAHAKHIRRRKYHKSKEGIQGAGFKLDKLALGNDEGPEIILISQLTRII
jgi:hypothetical protein